MQKGNILLWWSRRTGLEKSLILVVGFGTLSLILFLIISNSVMTRKKSADDDTCMTLNCIDAASTIITDSNIKINPCDDFYEFACGGFLRNSKIHEEYLHVGSTDFLTKQVDLQLQTIIEKNDTRNQPRVFQLVNNFYYNCINEKAIEGRGLESFKDMLKILGGWPVLAGDDWDDGNYSWTNTLSNIRELGIMLNCIISVDIDYDLKDNTKNVISLDEPSFGLDAEILKLGFNSTMIQDYLDRMVQIAEKLGANKTRAKNALTDSLYFELTLANISQSSTERNVSALYNQMKISELQENYPQINWLEYINKMLGSTVSVNKDEKITVSSPKFITNLFELLKSTPKRVQANYIMWRFIHELSPYLTKDIRNIALKYLDKRKRTKPDEESSKRCMEVITGKLPVAVGSMYARNYVNTEIRRKSEEITNEIRKKFLSILDKIDWMDTKTRKHAIEKANAMKFYISYPSDILDNKKLNEYYKNLVIEPGHYLESVINLTRFQNDYKISQLRKPVAQTDWSEHSSVAVVNAWYNPMANNIDIPAAILQGMYFDVNRPQYLNFGTIGHVIGHEISHGFDDIGRQFDKNGNLENWWDPETEQKFVDKAKCIVQQYNNYSFKDIGMNVNGFNTQGENIADIGATKIAYLAYKEWKKNNGVQLRLPGLPYTDQQLFWIGFASVWCEKESPKKLREQILTDEHSPSRFRVNGPVSNLIEFSNDFKCPLGSNMNPVHKCTVW